MMSVPKLNDYAECAKAAFKAAEAIAVNENAGLEPESEKLWAEVRTDGQSISVTVSYTLKPIGGCWSDSMYHVSEPDKVRKTVYKFKDGKMTRDDGPVFEEPWLKESKTMQKEFLARYDALIKATA